MALHSSGIKGLCEETRVENLFCLNINTGILSSDFVAYKAYLAFLMRPLKHILLFNETFLGSDLKFKTDKTSKLLQASQFRTRVNR